ncbi:MAG: hypothetical protein A2Y91_08355 [Chloroflexi bacterium RBG_13_54_8]|nr:MAG: hypothetical protein A2Y91_08355 [Chloroflexi bacterium RBG_13_54_8]
MTTANATIESRRFGVEIEVEGISTERARRELRLPSVSVGWVKSFHQKDETHHKEPQRITASLLAGGEWPHVGEGWMNTVYTKTPSLYDHLCLRSPKMPRSLLRGASLSMLVVGGGLRSTEATFTHPTGFGLEVARMVWLLEPVSRNQQELDNGKPDESHYERSEILEIYPCPNPPAYRLDGIHMQDQIVALAGNAGDLGHQLGLSQPC